MKIKVRVNGQVPATWNGQVCLCKGCGLRIGYADVEGSSQRIPIEVDDPKKWNHILRCPESGSFKRG